MIDCIWTQLTVAATLPMRNTVVVILLVLCMTSLTRVVADSFCGTGLVSCDGMSRIRRALCNGLSMCGDKLTREKREISDEDSSGSDSLEVLHLLLKPIWFDFTDRVAFNSFSYVIH
ncbi:uncharacterized protein LOC128190790 isoform X1 [Crassostrea angulata]|uniref:uncharacterized protein LOC128190790 isoform X1 n=1 Tax=Magallana angulata TaxID=2784310 RepID=UPI0022B16E16|nr:uncharacterized protein LOC128190790 isoform X1 [Crassostrea angulata]